MKTEKLTDSLSPQQYQSLTEVWEYIAATHSDLPAYTCLGKTLTYAEIDRLSSCFAAYLQQHTCLQPGDHIALQLPNVLQFPVAFFGALKAGLVVVNTNPLYTAHEMQHQFIDAEVKAIIILENFCDKLQAVLPKTQIETVIVTRLGDLQAPVKRLLVNTVIKYVKGMVPKYDLPQTIDFTRALASSGEAKPVIPPRAGDDIALLLYTGGTTGVSKGAMLTHKNLIANMMQLSECMSRAGSSRQERMLISLPLYYSYPLMLLLTNWMRGGTTALVSNVRDTALIAEEFDRFLPEVFVGITPIFLALCEDPLFPQLSFKELQYTICGGAPLNEPAAMRWREITRSPIAQGYGLTEASPVVTFDIDMQSRTGYLGKPLYKTQVRIVGDEGEPLPANTRGEIQVKGEQVMMGYVRQTERGLFPFTLDGWLRTGDIGRLNSEGALEFIERQAEVIKVPGFSVYPSEVEAVVSTHPSVLQCAVIGIPNEEGYQRIKLFVVTHDRRLTRRQVRDYCRQRLTRYKVPELIEFRNSLPHSASGRLLRARLLRESEIDSS